MKWSVKDIKPRKNTYIFGMLLFSNLIKRWIKIAAVGLEMYDLWFYFYVYQLKTL